MCDRQTEVLQRMLLIFEYKIWNKAKVIEVDSILYIHKREYVIGT